MEKKVFLPAICCLSLVLAMHFVMAEITLSEPSDAYSLGDTFSSSITLNPESQTDDFLVANLVCGNGQSNIYKNEFDLQPSEQASLTINLKFNRNIIGNLQGNCYLNAKYGADEVQSSSFSLSDKIDVSLSASSSSIDPGQSITVYGNATKANGRGAYGSADITIPDIDLSSTVSVSNGDFSDDILIPNDAAAGLYYISAEVYETDSSGNRTNKGSGIVPIQINHLAKSIAISLSDVSISPGTDLSYTPELLDQTGRQMEIDTYIAVYDSNGKLFAKGTAKSGQSNKINIPYYSPSGQWSITAYYNDYTANKSFNVEELRKADFSLVNQTLTIKNAGNVQYTGQINVSIMKGNETVGIKTIDVNLGINEAKTFKISAPNGNYTISIGDNESSVELGESYLTGYAISVKDIGNSLSFSQIWPWIWFIIIILLLAAAVYYYRKVRKGNYVGKIPALTDTKKFIPIDENSFPTKDINNEVKKAQTGGESSLISTSLNGSKEEVAVIALKIKNAAKLRDSQSSAFLTIEHILQKARALKAKVYDNGLFKIIIFSPKLTQKTEMENYTNAVKTAYEIDSALKDFNKKYAIKIDYGIGAHAGQMFLELVDGKAKFTSSGSTTIVAKNAAEKANNELLVSSLLHRKVYNIVKGEQTPSGLYKVNSILDRSQHSQFIQRFMAKKEKK